MSWLFSISSIGMFLAAIACFQMRTHTLSLLISLEYLMLCLLLFVLSMLSSLGSPLSLFMIFLTLSAIEAALGLSLLVSLLRCKGNDYLFHLYSY